MYGGALNGLTEYDKLTLVPLYSDDGGNTAVITSFAAVNRNAEHPKDAFKVIDLLMSTDRQANASLFHDYIYKGLECSSMPMHENVMNSQHEMRETEAMNQWLKLDNENFEEVCAVRDQITSHIFPGR